MEIELDGPSIPIEKARWVGTVVDLFVASCPLWQDHLDDIEWAKATYDENDYDYRAERYGWGPRVYIQVKLREPTSTFDDPVGAAGHTLHYYLGAGRRPGMTAAKRVAKRLAGLPATNGDDVFRDLDVPQPPPPLVEARP